MRNRLSDQVAASSQEMSVSIQYQSKNVYELSSLASELNNTADKLKKDVNTFKTFDRHYWCSSLHTQAPVKVSDELI